MTESYRPPYGLRLGLTEPPGVLVGGLGRTRGAEKSPKAPELLLSLHKG